MTLATRFPADTIVGRALRLPLRLLPVGARVPVVAGPLRGYRWTVGAGNHGCWLGTYDSACVRRFVAEIRRGDTVLDIGANVGYYTLAAARAVGSSGRVVAFEPLPSNADRLEAHLRMNGLAHVEVRRCAVADSVGDGSFRLAATAEQGSLGGDGDLVVPVVTLDHLAREAGWRPPALIKIDVEGAELRVLLGARETLVRWRPTLLVELHTDEMQRECPALLSALGYGFEPVAPWPGRGPASGTFLARATARH